MKRFGYFSFFGIVLISLFSIVFVSCSKDEGVLMPDNGLTWIYNIPVVTIQTLYTSAGMADMAAQVKYPVDIYKYTYTMNYREQNIEASGLVCVPVSSGVEFPVLSFQHGTLVAKTEAPSKLNPDEILAPANLQNITIAGMSGLGYVLVVPDLIGFGASESFFHPYLVKKSTVDAVVSMLASMRNLSNADLSGSSFNDSLFLAGYSQGGWATLAVLEELDNNSSPWDVVATVCGAGPYNPALVLDYVTENDIYLKPFFLPYVLLSFIEDGTIYGNMDKYFKEPYASRIPDLYDGTNTGSFIDAQLTTSTHSLLTDEIFNFRTDTNFQDILTSFDKNKVEAWNTDSPILLTHGAADVYIPKILSETMYQDFLDAGASNVQDTIIPGLDHNTAAAPTLGLALEWFQEFRSSQLLASQP